MEFAESVLYPAAEEYKEQHRDEDDDLCLQFFVGCDVRYRYVTFTVYSF